MAVVGVLALQGSYNEHMAGTRLPILLGLRTTVSFPSISPAGRVRLHVRAALRRIGVSGVEVRKPEQLLGVDSLIIPGGESTTMAKLANYHNLVGGLLLLRLLVFPPWAIDFCIARVSVCSC
jgi:pyridoxal 5'-phosphate synthase pdxT subunit